MKNWAGMKWRPYLIALFAGIAGSFVTISTPMLMARPYVLPFCAVFATGWFAGMRPALVCMAISILSVVSARVELLHAGWGTADLVQVSAFAIASATAASFARAKSITEREARGQSARLEAIFGQAAIGIAVIDLEGQFTRVNRRMAQIVGRTEERLTGLSSKTIIHPEDWEASRKPLRQMRAGERNTYAADGRYIRSDGSIVWVHVSVAPLINARRKVDGFVTIVEDITERRRASEALQLAHQQKDDFLALLSHELRNPLAPIRTAVQLLQMRGAPDDDARRLHGVIERQVQHLVRLVDDLLDVSRVLRDKVQLRPETVDIADAVASAVETARPLIDLQRQDLSVQLPEVPLYVHGDQIRLAQALGNLLTNASKYTDRSGAITLRVSREGDDVAIRVTDSGAGIPPALLPTIFEPFVQADRSLHRAQGGLGIGLTLVKKIVELHNGTVTVTSEGLGRGSEFTVRIPRLQVLPKTSSAERPLAVAAPPRTTRRVLIVDDNNDAADSLAMLLRSNGHEVASSRDGIDALRRVQSWKPDVVLLDIGLPGMSGYEVAEELRKDPNPVRPWLVALTGYGRDTDRQRALASGFDEHLVKPIDAGILEGVLQKCAAPAPRDHSAGLA